MCNNNKPNVGSLKKMAKNTITRQFSKFFNDTITLSVSVIDDQ